MTIREHTSVERIITENGRAVGVSFTDGHGSGEIRADAVVNAAGMWGRELGSQAGAVVPLHAAEHFYIVTDAIEGVAPQMPVLRDPDGCGYFKEEVGKLLIGWFEPAAKPWGMKRRHGSDGIPESFCFTTLPPDLDHIAPMVEAATHRMPVLADTGIQLFFNGPESFTPDDRYLLGESPDVRGLFMACGFNSIGIQSSGGAGKVLADWIVDGRPPMDLWDVDIRRMMPFQRNSAYLHDRTVEGLGLLYAMHWPYRQPETARGVRRSVLHDRLEATRCLFRGDRWLGACQLVRPGGRRGDVRLQLRPAELVRVLSRGALRSARARRCLRSVVLRQVRPRGSRRSDRAQPHLRQRHLGAGRPDRLHAVAQ